VNDERLPTVERGDVLMSRLGEFNGCLEGAAQYARACYARPLATLLKLLKSALVGGAVLGLVQPAFAIGVISSDQAIFPTSGQGIYAALLDLDGANARHAPAQRGDDAFSALSGFAQTVAAESTKTSGQKVAATRQDEAVFAELSEFAQRVGARQPVAHEPRVKLAEADNAVDALKDFLRGNGSPAPAAPAARPARVVPAGPPVEAHFVGEKVCATCHAGHAESFSKTLMGRIGKTQPGKFACENCHGAGSQHVKLGGGRGVGGIMSFRPDDLSHSVAEYNGVCLACHEKGDRTYWSGSVHEVRNVACTNCHTVMRSVSQKFQLKTVFEPETCFQCHKDKRAQMARSSHMPMREGKITCTDCHNPHGTANESLLRTATINDTCYKCHAEKRGPFLFEHEPVRVNCLNCHEAHGSINEFMLKISRPRLCAECHGFGHTLTGGPNSYQIMGRACNNCHTQIHGTNSPSGALLHR
jgi:DmsE family decaheme c-type cytochrome